MNPSNRFISGCINKRFEAGFDNGKIIPFGFNIEPSSESGYSVLNSKVYDGKYSQDFRAVSIDDQQSCRSNVCGTRIGPQNKQHVYTSNDPRLLNPIRNERMYLDRPPLNCSVDMDNVYNEELDVYGQRYTNYSDIKTGQIMYYTDKQIDNPYFNPVFEKEAVVTAKLYRDPMGSIQPMYDWSPTVVNRDCIPFTEKSLSSIDDSQFQRQDIMAFQMRKMNRQRYAPRWMADWIE